MLLHVTQVRQLLLNTLVVLNTLNLMKLLVRRLVEEDGQQFEGELDRYPLAKFKRSNSGTCYNQRPIVSVGDVVIQRNLSGWSFNGTW